MAIFTGAHPGRLDTKGRILVPKPFRDILQAQVPRGAASLRLRPSDRFPCIEGWPMAEFEEYTAKSLAACADEAAEDDFNALFLWPSLALEPDSDGRLKLPASFVQHAGLAGDVRFLGSGKIFEIWALDAAQNRMREAAQRRSRTAPPLAAAEEA